MTNIAAPGIWTIGHSTRPIDFFIRMLLSFNIQLLADIRRYPGSAKFPHFNTGLLSGYLREAGIDYRHFPDLGGRRKPRADSENTAWRSDSFRGYADYMETEDFKKAVCGLEKLATEKKLAYMCSEAVWWRCHRALVSDFLKAKGWKVMHITDAGKASEHPFTSPAKMVQGKLFYH